MPDYERIKPPITFAVGNDRRSPYRFRITNLSWDEAKDAVSVETFAGKRRLQRLAWHAFPTVTEGRARRQGRTEDILVCATYCGQITCYSAVWLLSGKGQRLKLLADGIHNADGSRLARGIVREEEVWRWIDRPPADSSYQGEYHRTWTYDRKAQRLRPGPWFRGEFRG